MRKLILLCSMMSAGLFSITSCDDANDEFDDKGSCSILSFTGQESAYMGDSIAFSFQVASQGVPLNQAKVQLLFDENIVSERFLSVGENNTYSAKLFVPFLANVPDGTAKAVVYAQNERFAKDRKEREIQIQRPHFEKLYLKSSKGVTYEMTENPNVAFEYVASSPDMPSDLEGYIEIPAYKTNGNKITFGAEDGIVTQGSTQNIEYMIDQTTPRACFNTKTFEASPAIKFALNGQEFIKKNDNEFYVEREINQNERIVISGMKKEWAQYWIDPSWFNFKKNTEKKELVFRAITGKYKFTVDKKLKFIKVEAMNGDAMASLLENGTGTIWTSGNNAIGKPNLTSNNINWSPAKMFCLSPIETNKYEFIFEGGKQLGTGSLNFKFFYDNTQSDGNADAPLAFNQHNKLSLIGNAGTYLTVSGTDGNIKHASTKFAAGQFYRLTITVANESRKGELDIEEINETLPKEVD